MDTIKVRIDGHECEGTIKERSQTTRPAKDGHGHALVHIVFVDLDTKCILSDSAPPPLAEVEVADAWRPAAIDRIPTAPHFRRIILSFED
jgi:hypothetical protein